MTGTFLSDSTKPDFMIIRTMLYVYHEFNVKKYCAFVVSPVVFDESISNDKELGIVESKPPKLVGKYPFFRGKI